MIGKAPTADATTFFFKHASASDTRRKSAPAAVRCPPHHSSARLGGLAPRLVWSGSGSCRVPPFWLDGSIATLPEKATGRRSQATAPSRRPREATSGAGTPYTLATMQPHTCVPRPSPPARPQPDDQARFRCYVSCRMLHMRVAEYQ